MIYLLFIASLFISILYIFIIMQYLDGWNETPIQSTLLNNPSTKVSIIVPVYNEQETIKSCLKSILRNNYPQELYEVFVVDNGSTDNTFQEIQSINHSNIRCLLEPNGFKKEALEKGLQAARGEFILLTDGDCIVGENWINSMVYHKEKSGAEMVLGPVEIRKYNNLLTRFQAFDMLAMMGITAGGVKKATTYLSNGANMAFAKNVYDSIGEIPRKDIPSGDDVFLLHEYIRSGGSKLFYNKSKNATVKTEAQKTWKLLVSQRVRWASKATSYVNKKDRYAAVFIFLYCFSIFINFVITPFTGGVSFFIGLFQLFIKGVIDYAFLIQINQFFCKKHLLRYFIPSFFVHFSYILFSGLSSLLKIRYSWRGKSI